MQFIVSLIVSYFIFQYLLKFANLLSLTLIYELNVIFGFQETVENEDEIAYIVVLLDTYHVPILRR